MENSNLLAEQTQGLRDLLQLSLANTYAHHKEKGFMHCRVTASAEKSGRTITAQIHTLLHILFTKKTFLHDHPVFA